MKVNSGPYDSMSQIERRAAFALASIYALRMVGLFMILPVFSLYAEHLSGVTPFLLGMAIGIYGLTQAALQIPFGMWSDRLGRKPVITVGFIIFALGSVVAALADSISGVIVGRALQGAGAIAAATMALAADLTREEQRTKIMAIIGLSIGLSFAVALIAGPVLNTWIGVRGIFGLAALFALGGIGVLYLWVPNPVHIYLHRDAELIPGQFKSVIRNSQLLRLDFGILALHSILTASFVVLPFVLRDATGLAPSRHWQIYLPVLVFSVLAMVPFILLAEKGGHMKHVLLGAILVLGLAEVGLIYFHQTVWGIGVVLWVFFTAFNLLEASLPSLISKVAPSHSKGTAMGVYSSSQFTGVFIGGMMGGGLYGWGGVNAVFTGVAVLAAVWLLIMSTMQNPRNLSSHMINTGPLDDIKARELASKLSQVAGVAEAVVIVEDGIAYLKVDNRTLDREALRELSAAQV